MAGECWLVGSSMMRTEREPAVWPCHLLRAGSLEGKWTNLLMAWVKAAGKNAADGQKEVSVGSELRQGWCQRRWKEKLTTLVFQCGLLSKH